MVADAAANLTLCFWPARCTIGLSSSTSTSFDWSAFGTTTLDLAVRVGLTAGMGEQPQLTKLPTIKTSQYFELLPIQSSE
jgi:hypothetical protein